MAEHAPTSRSERHLVSSGWYRQPPLALCDVDTCAWKHRGVSLVATKNEVDEHVLSTGHRVTIIAEERMTVAPLRGAA